MSDTPVDMRLPEAFHRLKRTSMLFSSGLALFGLAVPESISSIKLPVIELGVPAAVAVGALWCGATYYLLGFLLELRLAVRLNTPVMLSAGAKSYEAELEKAQGQLKNATSQYLAKIEHAVEASRRAAEALEGEHGLQRQAINWERNEQAMTKLEEMIDAHRNKPLDMDTANAMGSLAGVVKGEALGFMSRYRSFLEVVERGSDAVAGLRGVADRIDDNLQRAHRDFTRLSPMIAGERKVAFWAWEFGGAMSLFFLANTFAFRNLVDALRTLHSWLI